MRVCVYVCACVCMSVCVCVCVCVGEDQSQLQYQPPSLAPLGSVPLASPVSRGPDTSPRSDGAEESTVSSVQALVQSITEVQEDFTFDFQKNLEHALAQTVSLSLPSQPQQSSSSSLLQAALRPPHDPAYFPCHFADCLFCGVRRVYVDALARARTELTREIAGFLRAHNSQSQPPPPPSSAAQGSAPKAR